jgi:hypothetical protein
MLVRLSQKLNAWLGKLLVPIKKEDTTLKTITARYAVAVPVIALLFGLGNVLTAVAVFVVNVLLHFALHVPVLGVVRTYLLAMAVEVALVVLQRAVRHVFVQEFDKLRRG